MYETYRPFYVENFLNITLARHEGYKCWEAKCATMGLREYGETEKEAREKINDMISHYITAHCEYNIDLKYLAEKEGIKIQRIGNKIILREKELIAA